MVKVSVIKKQAKLSLKKSFGICLGASLLLTLFYSLLSITGIGGLFVNIFTVGYCSLYVAAYRHGNAKIEMLFSGWKNMGPGLVAGILVPLYTFLWSLLFVIPGIVKSYSYAMVNFIIQDNPSMTASQAITLSRHMMKGHKWKLFWLEFSFIVWHLLGVITLGLSNLYFIPYSMASHTAFYEVVKAEYQQRN